jgi:hypothetical protein
LNLFLVFLKLKFICKGPSLHQISRSIIWKNIFVIPKYNMTITIIYNPPLLCTIGLSQWFLFQGVKEGRIEENFRVRAMMPNVTSYELLLVVWNLKASSCFHLNYFFDFDLEYAINEISFMLFIFNFMFYNETKIAFYLGGCWLKDFFGKSNDLCKEKSKHWILMCVSVNNCIYGK